ncbi:glycosyltransferase [Niallia taxi]|uniref:glycosyltransferase n=1 Tax=Niallia taxi TaxID=2499688 RepID=UPI00316D2451
MLIDIVLTYVGGQGGVENVITPVSQGLVNRGHKVRVILAYPSQNPEWEETLPEYHYYGTVGNMQNETLQSLSLGYENLLTKIGKPNLVLATHAPSLSYVCRSAIASVPGVNCPIISWLHGPPEYFGYTNTLKYSDAHLAISSQIQFSIEKFIYPDIPIYNIGNPVNVKNNKTIKRSEDRLELLYVGRLHLHDKRLDILLRGLQHVKGEWRLRIIGAGTDEDQIRKLSIDLGIQHNLEWLGWKENPWDEIDEASLLILSSDFEGFGLVLVESLSRGIPVVSTMCSGPLDIIEEGKNGWLYPIRDFMALGDILQDIIDGKKTLPSSEDCISSVQRFDSEEVIGNIELVAEYYVNGEGKQELNNNYIVKDDIYHSSTSEKNILNVITNGIEYLGTTHRIVSEKILNYYFTNDFLKQINLEGNLINEESIYATVLNAKLEKINYSFSKAKVQFLLINKGVIADKIIDERLAYTAKLINDQGIWKINSLELLN